MSFFRKTVCRRKLPAHAALSRLLLDCRFDLQQKAWSLPSPDIRRDTAATLPAVVAALAFVICHELSGFSYPALVDDNSSKTSHFKPKELGRGWRNFSAACAPKSTT